MSLPVPSAMRRLGCPWNRPLTCTRRPTTSSIIRGFASWPARRVDPSAPGRALDPIAKSGVSMSRADSAVGRYPGGDLDASLIREVRFTARHHYGWPSLTEEENRRRYGPQVPPHEHEWRLRVEVLAPPDPATGFVVDLPVLERALDTVVRPWAVDDMNEGTSEHS